MTREEYIEAVKVKLEEVSPFDEPNSFIAADNEPDYKEVKPIISYIEKTLDEAAHNCLQALPLTLLHADIVHSEPTLTIADDGVATFTIQPNTRFVRFRHPDLRRDITAFITSEDPIYLLQQNKYTRGGQSKPIAVVSSDEGKMEIYTLLPESQTDKGVLLSIETDKIAENVLSPIEDYIVLECAAMASDIMSDTAAAQTLRQEQQTKVQAILQ